MEVSQSEIEQLREADTNVVSPEVAPTCPKIDDTQVSAKTLVDAPSSEACLVAIYPTGPSMGTRYKLGGDCLILGRDDQCNIQVDDPSVSRRHAEIRPGMAGHYVIDRQSTNGTFVNDRPASTCKLKDGDYLRVGNWIFRYLAGGNVESQYHEEIYRLTILDALTGAHNKRSLLEFLERELARSSRHRRPLTLIMFDIDHFKAINDRHGHLAGDYALRELAGCVKAAINGEQLFARYGGEEFAIVLPETPREDSTAIAERLRALIEKHHFEFEGKHFPLTISLGVFTTCGDVALTPSELLRQADEKLYQAKNAGRNQVVS